VWQLVVLRPLVAAGGLTARKSGGLSALELVGPLVVLAAGHSFCANEHVTCWVDNAGSVAIWMKGYSTKCRLSSTIVTTFSTIAAAIGCKLHIEKISHCSNTGASIVDAISKGEFVRVKDIARAGKWPLQLEPARLLVSLLKWIDKPVPPDDLTKNILREIAVAWPVLNYSV
jgi:hypothetical protein